MNDASNFSVKLLTRGGVKAEVGQAYIAGENLYAGTMLRGQERIGSLAASLAGLVADKESEGEVRILIQKLADLMHAQEASSPCYEEDFIVLH
jgi:hypothetical protein